MDIEHIGIIGSGIGGLGAAWALDARYRVTLLERDDRLGGHTNTLTIADPQGDFPVDTGFMVFNRRNYPLLRGLFADLGVASYPTSMSFAASLDDGRIEWAGDSLNTLFGQRRNLLDPGFLRMAWEIPRFNRAAKAALAGPPDPALALDEFLRRGGYSERFATDYLLPMGAAIWSCPAPRMRAFPFISLARFFANHGLLDLVDRPHWETVRGGSRTYVERIRARLRGACRTGCAVTQARRTDQGVRVETATGETFTFDALILACHADQALGLIAEPSAAERDILGCLRYQRNEVYVHEDEQLMPRTRRVWSSWNYLRPRRDPTMVPDSAPVTVTYWMNSLQDLPAHRSIFVSLNPPRPPREETVLARIEYDHPLFDTAAMAAQARLHEIQGRDRLWFSGAYWGYGFHEDGLRAAVAVARGLGVEPAWASSGAS